ncbi:uncharacterized protein LOC114525284 [Dendronephthya gigantea]|uniref:uncharacterized protein LOC114525284 n=1 Tax=Dendronephthya gigantea TaxID=151771 RepID=UPI001068F169|nr:uncharacterized protein LOC114525284 [Dendronephthya gigantea]
MSLECDLLIINGLVIDPANDIDQIQLDIAVKDGKILNIFKPGENTYTASEIFDASGCYLTPGLIDVHVHCYEHVTSLGINPDDACLSRGVTTVVDAGSAGCGTFQGLRKFIIERNHTRVLAFLHITSHGLAGAGCSADAAGGELDSLNHLQLDECVKCIEDNKDVIVGIKIRLSESISNNGANEQEAYRRALMASKEAKVPLMVHHTISSIPLDSNVQLSCPGNLRAGDIYTHTFHGHKSTIADLDRNSLHPIVHKTANQNGILFDVGHGQGSFSWKVADIASHEGFYPHLISTDLHLLSVNGPAYDLVTVMSKFYHLGMNIYDVIKAVTSQAANAIGWGNRIGSLSIGALADITILRLITGEFAMEDCEGNKRTCTRLFQPVAVWKDGVSFPIKAYSVQTAMKFQ